MVTKSTEMAKLDLSGNHLVSFMKCDGEMQTDYLQRYVGDKVTIYCIVRDAVRSSFANQISISGVLEYYQPKDQFRVLIDDGTYSYFNGESIIEVGSYGVSQTFKNGSKAVVKLMLN